jgi:hypothetical protein
MTDASRGPEADSDSDMALDQQLERALAIRETRLGAEHPDTQQSRRDLAAVVSALENRW